MLPHAARGFRGVTAQLVELAQAFPVDPDVAARVAFWVVRTLALWVATKALRTKG